MISNPVDTILVVYKCIKIQLWTCCCKTQMSLSAHSQFFSINFLETHSLWFLSNIHTNFEAISQNHTLLLCSFRKPLLFCCRKHLITWTGSFTMIMVCLFSRPIEVRKACAETLQNRTGSSVKSVVSWSYSRTQNLSDNPSRSGCIVRRPIVFLSLSSLPLSLFFSISGRQARQRGRERQRWGRGGGDQSSKRRRLILA